MEVNTRWGLRTRFKVVRRWLELGEWPDNEDSHRDYYYFLVERPWRGGTTWIAIGGGWSKREAENNAGKRLLRMDADDEMRVRA